MTQDPAVCEVVKQLDKLVEKLDSSMWYVNLLCVLCVMRLVQCEITAIEYGRLRI